MYEYFVYTHETSMANLIFLHKRNSSVIYPCIYHSDWYETKLDKLEFTGTTQCFVYTVGVNLLGKKKLS